ncbi:hypothetical protein K438DRAFT_1771892 [Mycena galopus ATCC 62051]|nr:hypothetical protein K438DRAFT_1771892 [Mycena galopus ATCC 62051]
MFVDALFVVQRYAPSFRCKAGDNRQGHDPQVSKVIELLPIYICEWTVGVNYENVEILREETKTVHGGEKRSTEIQRRDGRVESVISKVEIPERGWSGCKKFDQLGLNTGGNHPPRLDRLHERVRVSTGWAVGRAHGWGELHIGWKGRGCSERTREARGLCSVERAWSAGRLRRTEHARVDAGCVGGGAAEGRDGGSIACSTCEGCVSVQEWPRAEEKVAGRGVGLAGGP